MSGFAIDVMMLLVRRSRRSLFQPQRFSCVSNRPPYRSCGTKSSIIDNGVTQDSDETEAAEVSHAAYYSDTWPDGTPKKYRGGDAWKNFIDFDSPHTTESDILNRQRHYFFHMDSRGRLWRKELHRLESHEGQLRDPKILNFFFGHMQRNTTGHYASGLPHFPFVSFRAHEHYYTSCAEAPIVFNDLRDGDLLHHCPGGEIAHSITTRFDPTSLRMTADGKLLHPVVTKAVDAVGGRPRTETLLALIESSTAHTIFEHCEERGEAVILKWRGEEMELKAVEWS